MREYGDLRKKLSADQVDKYLERMGIYGRPFLNAEGLDLLICAHLGTVPFDNSECWGKKLHPSLATDDLYKKVVEDHRGGYCFELNTIFNKLLLGLGFDAYLVFISIGADPDTELSPALHCGNVVVINGEKHFADVGFGGPIPYGSVPFSGELKAGHRIVTKGIYTIVGTDEPCFDDETDGNGGKHSIYSKFLFKDSPVDPSEFLPANHYVSCGEDSFRRSLMLNLTFSDGYYSLNNGKLVIKRGDYRSEIEVRDNNHAKELAREYFLIPDLPVPEEY